MPSAGAVTGGRPEAYPHTRPLAVGGDPTLGLPAADRAAPGRSAPAAPARRGRLLVRVSAVTAVVAAVFLAVGSYQALASLHLVAAHPLAAALGWLAVSAVAALGAGLALLLAVLAVARCRPRWPAGLALAAALALPVAALAVGVGFGVGAVEDNLVADSAGAPAAAADLAVDAMDAWGVDAPAPVRRTLEWLAARRG